MRMATRGVSLLLIGLALAGCVRLKYEILKRTSVPNPPVERIKVYIKEFPVDSRASVVEPLAAVSYQYYDDAETSLQSTATALAEIARSSRIEDLSASLLRELRRDQIRTLLDVGKVSSLNGVRLIDNPFELVPPDDAEARLEIMGKATIYSQRLGDQFSRNTSRVDIEVGIKDLQTGKVHMQVPFPAGINMVYNSRELEEAMAVTVATVLARKTPF